jgi:hypothetical protein
VAGLASAALAVSLTAGAMQGADHESSDRFGGGFDLAASALTGPNTAEAVDEAWLIARSGSRLAKADTSASASAGCDDCTADSTALHIVYLDRPVQATLDNVSIAWSECTGCRATAVSVQVVVLRSPQTVIANNRALALNAACKACVTGAAAFQLVVIGDRRDRLSRAAQAELREWVASVAAELRNAPQVSQTTAADPITSTTSALDQLEAMVDDALGGARTVNRDADIRTGTEAAAPEAPPSPSGSAPSPSASVEAAGSLAPLTLAAPTL